MIERRSWATINAPPVVAQTYRERVGQWRLPVLSGVITAPTLRSDSSLLDIPGYDSVIGLLYEPAGRGYPEVPDRPSKQEC